MSLIEYGWDEHFANAYDKIGDKELIPARIVADYGQAVRTVTQDGELLVNRHIHEARSFGVGDFVCLKYDPANRIYGVGEILPRKTKFSRTAAGIILKEQIVAANIDTVFVMQSLNSDFNMRRLERYLIAAWESGAMPVIILTKSDLCDDLDGKFSEVFAVAAGVTTHAVSAVTGEGMDDLRQYFISGKTIAFLGSSGVGKSTLVNVLAGKEILKTQEVLRDDDRGRHTTSHRQLVLIPGGGIVMDTPGMRTMSLWEAETGMDNLFGDVEELAQMCRFTDCRHESEPGCAIKQALEDGALDESRWKSYFKLQKELAHVERRKEQKQRLNEKQFSKMVKNNGKEVW